jgi:opacity protein-like surface antigen
MNALKSLTIVAGLLAAAPAFAAEGADAGNDNPTGPGAGALVFSLTNLISTPSAMDGVGVGGVYFFNQKMAVRAGLGFLKSSTESDPGGAAKKSEASSLGVGLEGGVEYVLMSNKSVNIWGGGLLQIGYQSSEQKDVKEDSSTSFALAGALGADWFFADHMSLGAEYRLGVQSVSTESKPDGGTKSSTSAMNIGVGSAALRLGFWF